MFGKANKNRAGARSRKVGIDKKRGADRIREPGREENERQMKNKSERETAET